jgi:hypothetical protein
MVLSPEPHGLCIVNAGDRVILHAVLQGALEDKERVIEYCASPRLGDFLTPAQLNKARIKCEALREECRALRRMLQKP